jgi:hypothetical protein
MGRPRIDLDEKILYDLAFLGLSNQQIATAMSCGQATLSQRADLAEVLKQARDERSESIVRLWADGPGANRVDYRVDVLVELVRAAERRKIQRIGTMPGKGLHSVARPD